MTNAIARRGIITAAAIMLLMVATGVAAMHLAAQLLKTSIEQSLAPQVRFESLHVGLTNVEIRGVVVPAPPGWPAATSFSAQRVLLVPDLRDLASGEVVIDHAILEGAYFSALDARDGSGMRILPGIFQKAGNAVRDGFAGNRGARGAVVGTVEFADCTIDLYDAKAGGMTRTRVDGVNGAIDDVAMPRPAVGTLRDLKGLIIGAQRRAGAMRREGDMVRASARVDAPSPAGGRAALLPRY